ncbi:MAG: DeoR/GlpR family DNA-binding transcription regulator [Vallitaleaceae bacterium]|nr:DeoR/GlpR family DNA-binding transcription regulator [Vallitaleaceae bacterium]
MLAKERLLYILERLSTQPSVTIQSLSDELQVSSSTIQRDLNILETEGKVQRERGGAISKNLTDTLTSFKEISVGDKEHIHVTEKQLICRYASENVKDGDCIFVDSGTTPTYLIPTLVQKKIKIVTNSHYFLTKIIKESSRGEIYILGGEYNPKYDMTYGSITIDMLKRFRFDHSFFSASGYDFDLGEIYAVEFDLAAIKRAAMERSNKKHLLIDYSKYAVKGMCSWAKQEEFTTIYTDKFIVNKKKPQNMIVCNGLKNS